MTLAELNSVRTLKMRLEATEILLRRTLTALATMTQLLSGMPKAQALADKVATLTIKKIALEAELPNLRGRLEEAAIELATRICQEYDDETAQTLLLLRYVECLSWTQVAERMNYTRRNCFYLQKKIFSLYNTT